jgi:hypothetical protein
MLSDAAQQQGTTEEAMVRLALKLQTVEMLVGRAGQQQGDSPLSHAVWKAIITKDKVRFE